MKKNILIILFLSMSITLFAQNRRILTPDGKLHAINEVKRVKVSNGFNPQTVNYNSPTSTIDTLRLDGPWDTNFSFFGQDWMLQWFECPADLILKKVGFACYENPDMMSVEVKVVAVNWSTQELLNAEVLRRGYYEALGNGYYDITAFLDNPDITDTNWISVDGGLSEPFGNDIWSDGSPNWPPVPIGNNTTPTLQWVDLRINIEPQLNMGDIFGVAIKHTGPIMDNHRIGFWAHKYEPPIPGWKFYANGRKEPGVDYGWWTREYSWDFVAEVELIADRGPVIHSFTQYLSGMNPDPFIIDAYITDDNPADPPNAGVASVKIFYSFDEGRTWQVVIMSGTEPNYTAQLPTSFSNSRIIYFIEAVDFNSNITQSVTVTYFIFTPTGATTLVIFNGFDEVDGYPQDYYWGPDLTSVGSYSFERDEWAYGQIPNSLLEYYDNIIEICSDVPKTYNDDLIRLWLAENGSRNYFLAGQDWLGGRWEHPKLEFQPGDFEYDILGITHNDNDVSYLGISGHKIPSQVIPEEGTLFGQPLLDLFNSLSPPADSMMYNPNLIQSYPNWIDAFDILSDVTVDMNVETRSIDRVPAVEIKPAMIHRTLPAGNKIVFLSLDPLSITSAVDSSYPYFYWMGFDSSNVTYQALRWFGVDIVTDVLDEETEIKPTTFKLFQNYPNPFNPSTKIQYAISSRQFVSLKVYDVLGNEIATLVSEEKPAGEYEVEFNVAQNSILSSGIYFYQLKAGSFIQTKKMILIK